MKDRAALEARVEEFLDQYNFTPEVRATYRAKFDALFENASNSEIELMFNDVQLMLQQQKLRKN